MNKKTTLKIVSCVIGIAALGLVALFFVPSGKKKITAVDLDSIYSDFHHSTWFAAGWNFANITNEGREVSIQYLIARSEQAAISQINTETYQAANSPLQAIGQESFFTKGMNGPRHELWFRRLNLVAKISRNQNVAHASSDAIDREEIEQIAVVLDEAVRSSKPSITFTDISFGSALWKRTGLSDFVMVVVMYLGCGSVTFAISVIPIVLLWLLTRLVQISVLRLIVRCGIFAFFLAPGAIVGHGVWFGPTWVVLFGGNSREISAAILSMLVTWIIFVCLALAFRAVRKRLSLHVANPK